MSIRYYVYAYIDPVTNEPFYIGKGHGDRAYLHLSRPSCYKNLDSFFYRKLHKMIDEGIEPLVFIIKENLTEEVAYEVESILIHLIGTRAHGTGPLCNLYVNFHGAISGFTLQQSIKHGHTVESWGEVFPSISAISRDPRCLVSAHALRYRLKLGMSIEDAATRQGKVWQAKPPKPQDPSQGAKMICWGEEFDSRTMLANDPRCVVTSQQLYNRISWGWNAERAATTPLYQ